MPPKKTTRQTPEKKKTKPAAPAKSAVKKVVRKSAKPAVEKQLPEIQPAVLLGDERGSAAERYWEAVGRRKTAVARVRFFTRGEKGIWVNEKSLSDYFQHPHLQRTAEEAIKLMNAEDHFHVSAKVNGGGVQAQAEAVRHGTARALVLFNADFRKRLKRAGFLTRDPRMVERKKFGLKKARRAPQWAKR